MLTFRLRPVLCLFHATDCGRAKILRNAVDGLPILSGDFDYSLINSIIICCQEHGGEGTHRLPLANMAIMIPNIVPKQQIIYTAKPTHSLELWITEKIR